jgi:beta-aspartyl-peptidase (threonine type)
MEATDHVLLAGEGARRFARSQGFPEYDPVTAAARERWQRLRQKLGEGEEPLPRLSALIRSHPELAGGDTVGAVARDHTGALAAATSTGGIMLRLPGRVGDTPLPGAGTYADGHCAVSATGWGELMMRFGTARALAAAVANGDPLDSAAASLLREMAERVGTEAGLIAVDREGSPAIAHGTSHLPHAWGQTERSAIRAAMAQESRKTP